MHCFLARVLLSALVGTLAFAPIALAVEKGIDAHPKGTSSTTNSARRLALVVGNSAYRHSGTLANPARDAELMARTLQQVGFELYGGGAQTELSRLALDQAIENFGNSLRAGDVALFYYSGHGLQVAGENYLVPVDADIRKEAEVRVKTVPVNLLFAKLDGIPNAVNIVILDACRNNPFARSFRSTVSGLATVSAPTGTLVAFSTAPGQVAEDGSGNNSPYTAALAKYVREPGLRVEDVFKRVRSEVSETTKGSQTPWENTSLTGDFAFIEGDSLELRKAELAAAGAAKSAELERLLQMEAEAAKQKEREQAEIAKREAEVARMDAEIAAMRQRLGAGKPTGGDSLKSMVAMVDQREEQARRLEALRQQREAEEQKRQQEISRMKAEAETKRRAVIEADISDYEKIAQSPFGKDMEDAAWQTLVGKYSDGAEIKKGDTAAFRQLVVEGLSLAEVKERQVLQERIKEQESYLTSAVGDMVLVNGGCFQMGDTFGGGEEDEKPVHEVCVSDFKIAKYEVTQRQWQHVMGGNLPRFSSCQDCPVERVNWEDVQEYLRQLNHQTGKNFRLPTEAEWEYAARSGGKQEKYAGGDNFDAVAWHRKNSGGKTQPVGQKAPNGLGLYDMSGNVWEWCSDWFDANYYRTSPRDNPQGPANGSYRSKRGGGWNGVAELARTSSRHRGAAIRIDNLGFRLVLPAEQ